MKVRTMNQKNIIRSLLFLCCVLLGFAPSALQAQVTNYTDKYNNQHTGENTNETVLTPSNVNSTQFGKLWTFTVDDQLYAQPLYAPGVSINGGTHNVLYLATMNNSLYAVDADSGTQYWHKTYGTHVTVGDTQAGSNTNISHAAGLGIESTPTIDPSSNTIYFVSQTESGTGGSATFTDSLNAADISTGNAKFGSPVSISGTYTSSDGTLTFVTKDQNQRPGLTLANGTIYLAWSSHGDLGSYHGWAMAYNATTLSQIATYSDVTTGSKGGIWQAGQGFNVDSSGNVYLSTGNGSFGASTHGVTQTGESFVKFSPTLQLLDYFTPYNAATLDSGDEDLGCSGVLAIPGTSYITGGGKEGVLYLVNTSNMGHFDSSGDQVVQEFQAVMGNGTSHIHGAPIYWNSAVNGPVIYVWGENDYCRGFRFTNNLYDTTPFAKSTMTAPETNDNGAMPGGFLCISANGNTNGILWASTPYQANAVNNTVEGVFHAFNADTMAEIWNDKQNDARDDMGDFAKYVPPLVDNGKVYLATWGPSSAPDGSGQLAVYGELSSSSNDFPGTYELQVEASGLALNVAGASKTDGAEVVQYPFGGGSANAEWTFTPTSDGY